MKDKEKEREKEEVEAIMESIETLFSGRFIKKTINTYQSSLEELRPLPTSFETKYDLMAHFFFLYWTLPFPKRSFKRQASVHEFREYYQAKALEAVGKTVDGAFPAQRVLNVEPNIRSAQSDRRLNMNGADRFVSLILGNGDVIFGWEIAWKMVARGLNGGIRELRRRFVHHQIKYTVRMKLGWIQDKIMRNQLWDDPVAPLTVAEAEHCKKRICKLINDSQVIPRKINNPEIFLDWDRVIVGFIDTMLDSYLPNELG